MALLLLEIGAPRCFGRCRNAHCAVLAACGIGRLFAANFTISDEPAFLIACCVLPAAPLLLPARPHGESRDRFARLYLYASAISASSSSFELGRSSRNGWAPLGLALSISDTASRSPTSLARYALALWTFSPADHQLHIESPLGVHAPSSPKRS
jgi:hypothetical protein